jgi:two-component system response regulator HydG
MTTRPRVLVVDDDRSMCELLDEGLRRRGFDVEPRTSAEEALVRSSQSRFDVVVSDLRMKGMDGLALCTKLVERDPDLPVIVLTAFGSIDTAVAAMRAGAYDFATKPVQLDALALVVSRAVANRKLREEVKRLRDEIERGRELGAALIGESPAILQVRELLVRLADADINVLVTGESGTGKEVVARLLHERGARAKGPFVAINVAAMPESLLESELFGHAKGAFTDAHTARTGLFERAHGGTLFLDEIGEMPPTIQPKLLRVLEERKVRPLGASREVPVDVRIVAATNRDLQTAIEEKRFREDLYFRLDGVNVDLPPLRARGSDVILLAQHFLIRSARRTGEPAPTLSPRAAERLLAYEWPGNVRELRNCIERAIALSRDAEIGVDDLPERVRDHASSHVVVVAEDPSELVSMEEVERRYVLRVLQAVAGNRTAAARILGFDRKTLYRKLVAFGVEPRSSS